MSPLGRHAIRELYGCDPKQLRDTLWLKEEILSAAIAGGATIVTTNHGQARNEGYFAEVIIAESHVIIETFPLACKASIEAFTCGDTIDPEKIVEKLTKLIKHEFTSTPEMFPRGILGNDIIPHPHKPTLLLEDT
jgi:S-adenosylmethionine decarboxylase